MRYCSEAGFICDPTSSSTALERLCEVTYDPSLPWNFILSRGEFVAFLTIRLHNILAIKAQYYGLQYVRLLRLFYTWKLDKIIDEVRRISDI